MQRSTGILVHKHCAQKDAMCTHLLRGIGFRVKTRFALYIHHSVFLCWTSVASSSVIDVIRRAGGHTGWQQRMVPIEVAGVILLVTLHSAIKLRRLTKLRQMPVLWSLLNYLSELMLNLCLWTYSKNIKSDKLNKVWQSFNGITLKKHIQVTI